MCGIAGYIGPGSESFIKAACNTIMHRGPDGEGFYLNGEIALGHRRLSIIDLSENGSQPMISSDGNFVIIFNGEIYNHLDLKKELLQKGYTFKSTSDTETLLYGYIEYGEQLFNRLNGIFALAVHDKLANKIVIARDQFGVKPLYYYNKDGKFAFGSEMKILKDIPGFDKTLNPLAFFYYLQLLYCPGEITPFKHVQKLLPGHYLTYNLNSRTLSNTQYYQMSFNVDHTDRTESEWIDILDTSLTAAVKRQLMSDVPVGFFLSGGLDSSMIVAMAKKIQPDTPITCFTIDTGNASSEEGLVDDYYYAKKIAEHLHVDLKVFPAKIDILSEFDKMIWHLDEPQADPAPLNVYNICSSARQMDIKVLLGGTAGDDIFSGYRRHQALRLEPFIKIFPRSAVKITQSLLSSFDVSNPLIRRSKKILREVNKTKNQRFAGYFTWIDESTVSGLFSEYSRQLIKEQILPEAYLESKINELPLDTDDLNKLLYLEFQGFLPDHNLNYTDKMSMAVGVETRVPFLDTELVQLATSIPVALKMKGNETKYLLKKLGERYLPKDAIYRPKTGFGAPIRKWIREDMHEMIEERLSFQKITERNIFDPQKVKELIDANESGKIDASYNIWALLAIESWLMQFFD